jgi:hypothetical protein
MSKDKVSERPEQKEHTDTARTGLLGYRMLMMLNDDVESKDKTFNADGSAIEASMLNFRARRSPRAAHNHETPRMQ